jgi:hypothetical protein
MGARRIRREQRRHDMAESRIVNGHQKQKERVRRQVRMVDLIKKGKFPYTPSIMTWISVQLHKPASRITEDEVKKLVAKS